MDFKLIVTDNSWDLEVASGIATYFEGDIEMQQRATIAAYMIVNTIPALPTIGNDWVAYLTKDITLNEIDAQIRASINRFTSDGRFMPTYDIVNGQLKMVVSRLNTAR